MESNEQTKLTSKMETDSDGEEDDTCSPIGWQGMWGGGVIEQKGKSNHGHGQQCGDCWGEAV